MRPTEFFRRNLGLKLVSLVLAYASWVYVVGRSPGVRFVTAPVEIVSPEGTVVSSYEPREVRVRLQGDTPALQRVSEQNVYARVQLDQAMRAGRPQKVAVQEREILGVPTGISREIVSPPLMVTIERRVARVVPVRVKVIGKPPAGYSVVRAWSEPASVEISGPENATRGVDQVWTGAIDASSHPRPFTASMDLIRPDPAVTLKPEQVRVSVLVDELPGRTEFELPVTTPGNTFTAEPAFVRVRLEGPPTLLSRITGRVVANADVSGLSGRSGTAPVRLDFPGLTADEVAKIRITLLDPQRVRAKR